MSRGCNLSTNRNSFANFKYFLTNKKELLAQLPKLTENESFNDLWRIVDFQAFMGNAGGYKDFQYGHPTIPILSVHVRHRRTLRWIPHLGNTVTRRQNEVWGR